MTAETEPTRVFIPDEPVKPTGWIVPAIIGSAIMMQTLNANVVVNALPAMSKSLHVDPVRLNLTMTVYLLASAVFMPASSWVADKFGARRVFLLAMLAYALGSALSGVSQNLGQMLVFRVIQGAAGAMMVPVGRMLLLRTTPKSELIGAWAILTMPALVGPMIGPVLGGAIITFFHWRWIFFLNLPMALAGVVLVYFYIPNIKERDVSPLDWLGILLTGLGLSGLVFTLETLGHSMLPTAWIVAMVVGSVVCLFLYWLHARNNPHAIIDLSIFRLPTFDAAVIGGAFLRIGNGSVPFLLAMLLQVGFGMSPLAAGLMTCVAAAGAIGMKTVAPPILRRYGFRTVLLVNGALLTLIMISYSLFAPGTPHWLIMVALAIGGFLRSLQFSSLNGLAFAEVEQHQTSRAATTSVMGQQLTQSIGIGLSAALLQVVMHMRGETHLTADTVRPVFALLGLLTVVSLIWFLRLAPDAGDEVSGRVRPTAA